MPETLASPFGPLTLAALCCPGAEALSGRIFGRPGFSPGNDRNAIV
ncbi:hypothetical protein [Terracidiphilus gabretensis]|nr:hypothetical protein [Terracidiphilus gabretensis]